MEIEHKSYMYRQGGGWIVATWDEHVHAYRLSHEMSYWCARTAVGRENCRHADDGLCQAESHNH